MTNVTELHPEQGQKLDRRALAAVCVRIGAFAALGVILLYFAIFEYFLSYRTFVHEI